MIVKIFSASPFSVYSDFMHKPTYLATEIEKSYDLANAQNKDKFVNIKLFIL